MRYDLDLVGQLCREIGLPTHTSDHRVEIDLGGGTVLVFQNTERDEDCLIGLLATNATPERIVVDWHTHWDHATFMDARGYKIKLNYLDLLTSLAEGRVLVCERHIEGQTVERWLVHGEYTEFTHLEKGERIIVRRVATRAAE